MMLARLLEGSRRPAGRALILPELMIRSSSLPAAPQTLPAPSAWRRETV
ncbi:hypothetical protein V2W30_33355 [Streptomyces sp. Q6]|uniref:Uncharacterized protein n=1 Tax=Streptomyces citrinus TaxID=3118173 RepID=A0ACD5AKM8_9ACTN